MGDIARGLRPHNLNRHNGLHKYSMKPENWIKERNGRHVRHGDQKFPQENKHWS